MKKTLRRLLSIVLTLSMLLSAMPLNALAYSDEEEEFQDPLVYTCGDYTYTLANNGATITAYSGNDSELVIPAELDSHKVVAIADEVFSEKLFIKSLVLPDTLTTLGWHAFYGNRALKAVYIPAALTSANDPFEDCITLSEVTFGEGMSYIPGGLFCGAGLEAITIPDSVEVIGNYAFTRCERLEEVTFGSGLKKIGEGAFLNCSLLGEVLLPDGLEELGYMAFGEMTALRAAYIPASLKYVNAPFEGCPNLSDITLAEGCTKIFSSLFAGTGISEIVIPDSVTEIGNYAFEYCERLESVTFGKGLKKIGDSAFYGCCLLTEAILPEGLEHLGYMALGGTDSLDHIHIPASLSSADAPFEDSSISSVTFADGLTKIDSSLFAGTGITEITIPDSVTEIGDFAFDCCEYLESVTFGKGLKKIGSYAFSGCSNLSEIILPEGLETIGYAAFGSIIDITELYIPASLDQAEHVFEYSGIGSVTFGSGISRIADGLFYDSELSEITIPDSVEEIGNSAFECCSMLESVTFGSGLKSIGSSAFANCDLLTEVILPEGLETLGRASFGDIDCLERVHIPSTLTYCGDPFLYTGLQEVTLGSGIYEIPEALFRNSGLSTLTVPDSVARIGYDAFAYIDELESVLIPESVIDIVYNVFYGSDNVEIACYPGSYAESFCIEYDIPYVADDSAASSAQMQLEYTSGDYTYTLSNNGATIIAYSGSDSDLVIPAELDSRKVVAIADEVFSDRLFIKSLQLPDTITSLGWHAFYNNKALKSVYIPASLTYANAPFEDCITLSEITFGDGITSIPATLFSGIGLEAVTIPDSVAEIGDYAFEYCERLESVTFGSGLKTIGSNAFYDCNLISEITLPEGLETLGYHSFGYIDTLREVHIPASLMQADNSFEGCVNLSNLTFADGVMKIFGSLFSGTGITELVIPDSVTEIGDYAFEYCERLESVTFGSGLKMIGDNAFYNCDLLSEVILPEGLERLNYHAFAENDSLEAVHIPACLTYANYPFEYSDNIDIVTFGSGISSIPNSLFAGSGISEIVIPDSVAEIGHYAFESCERLESVIFGSGLTMIGDNAFCNCDLLSEVILPENLETIGGSAFAEIDSIERVHIPSGLRSVYRPFEYSGIGSVTFGSGINKIADDLFTDSGISEVVIPDSVVEIGNYAFEYCEQLESITFGKGLKKIGVDAFYNCDMLTEAILPEGLETLESHAFSDIDCLERVYIPSTLIFSNAPFAYAGLQDATLGSGIYEIPADLFCESGLVSLIIPDNAAKIGPGAFSYCENLESVTIPESVLEIGYDAFYGSELLTVACAPDSYAESYCIENDIPYDFAIDSSNLVLTVTDSSGAALNRGYSVSWYLDGQKVSEGSKLHGYDPERVWYFKINLGEDLAGEYYEPAMQAVISAENNSVTYRLTEIPSVTVTGRILSENGDAVAGASLSFTQNFGAYTGTVETTSDENGEYSAVLRSVETSLAVTADRYADYSLAAIGSIMSGTSPVTLKDITLKQLTTNRVAMSLFRIAASETGSAGTREAITDISGLRFSIFSGNDELQDVTVRYPYIFLPEDVGSSIRIEIEDLSSGLTFAPLFLSLDQESCGSFTAEGLESGFFRIEDISARVLLYGEDGTLISAQSCTDGFSSEPLADGSYTLVLFGDNNVLRRIASLDALHALSIEKGSDYLELSGSIEAGRITAFSINSVPSPDLSKLRYTVPGGTDFSTSRSSTTVGKLITLKAAYEIDEKYESENEKIILHLPASVSIVEGSVTVNGTRSAYDWNAESRTVSIYGGGHGGTVRCVVTPLEAGEHAIDAFLAFDSEGTALSQQLGTVTLNASTLSFNLPDKTGQRNVSISGTGISESIVTIYDNGIPVAETTVNRGGTWSAAFTLSGSETLYAEHQVYAVLTSEKYGYQVSSEVRTIAYDPNYVSLSKITMINTAHTGEIYECISVIDFLKPSTERIIYNYWPNYPTFTFKVEFTRNDPTVITDVVVLTEASDGTITQVPCTYDARLGLWLGTHDYMDSHDKPAKVTAVYSCETYGDDLPTDALYTTEDLDGLLYRTYYSDRDSYTVSGMFGLGWTVPFDMQVSAYEDKSGSFILLRSPDGYNVFLKDESGVYRNTSNELSTASLDNGLVSITDPAGTVTFFNAEGKPYRMLYAEGSELQFNYSSGLLTSISDGGELSIQFSYEDGKVVRARFGDEVAEYYYDGDYLVSAVTAAGKESYTYHTDRSDLARAALESVTTADGNAVSYDYDSYGRLSYMGSDQAFYSYEYVDEDTVKLTDSYGNTTEYVYEKGQIVSVTSDSGATTRYSYTGQQLESVSYGEDVKYSYTYDDNGNLSSVTAPDGGKTSYRYSGSRLEQVTDPVGNKTIYTYDSTARLTAIKWADDTTSTYTYGTGGEIVSASRRDGSVTQIEYNEQGLPAALIYADGTRTDYTYDSSGNVISIEENGEKTLISYDTSGNTTMVVYPDGKTIAYTYDSLGRMSSVTDSAGTTTKYIYSEESGLPVKLTDGSGRVLVEYERDTAGAITKQKNANGTYTLYSYENGLPTGIAYHNADGSVISYEKYTIDTLGNITVKETSEGTWYYAYDLNSRLIKSTAPDGRITEYTYDAAGNRTSVTENGAKTDYSVGSANRYTSVGSDALTWDSNGSLTSYGDKQYEYDIRGRLIRYTDGTDTYEYGYDAFGHRNSVSVNGEVTEYVYDPLGGGTLLTAYSGEDVSSFVYGSGLVCQLDADDTYFYNFNILGSATELTDSTGAVVNSYTYSDIGVASREETVSNPFTYVGRYGIQDDGSDLYFVRERFVSAELGRFIMVDNAGNAYDTNNYNYAANNPTSTIDVNGELAISAIVTILVVSTVANVGAQAVSDLVSTTLNYAETGSWDWQGTTGGYVGATVGGLVSGIITCLSGGTLSPAAQAIGGAISEAIQSIVENGIDSKTFDPVDTAVSAILGAFFSSKLVSDAFSIDSFMNKGAQSWTANFKRMFTNIFKRNQSYKLWTIFKNTTKNAVADFFTNFFRDRTKNLYDYLADKFLNWLELIGIDDPSGYVFEAVDSNRLEGVTTTAYTKDVWYDDFGEPQEDVIVWEAEEFDQTNPLITNAQGRYAWDVPEGQWAVKFEKDGYETEWSEWLPVPPPQTEINMGMVSYAAPEVLYVTADEDGVTAAFSKYMIPSTVSIYAEADGSELDGSISAVNEERNSITGESFASIYRFTFDEKQTADSVSVTIPREAASYAGTEMSSDYTTSAAVTVRLTGFETSGTIVLTAGESLILPVQSLPARIGSGVRVDAASNSPSIISVSESSVTGDDGIALITISGELPGQGVFTLTAEGSEVSATFSVTVLDANAPDYCDEHGHSYVDGSCLRCGEPDPVWICFEISEAVPAGSQWFIGIYSENGQLLDLEDGIVASGQKYLLLGKAEDYEGQEVKCFFVDAVTFIPFVNALLPTGSK